MINLTGTRQRALNLSRTQWIHRAILCRLIVATTLFVMLALGGLATSSVAQDGKPKLEVSDQAMKVHQGGMLFDGHNDLPFAVRMRGGSSFDRLDIAKPTKLHTDIDRLRDGGLKAQFWSVFVPASTDQTGNALLMTLEQIQLVHDMCQRYPDVFEMADKAADVRRIVQAGKVASMIGVEGGHSIENSLQVLRMLYQRGARYMTLTHSQTLAWADSATDDAKNNGLSPFGKEVVREMNRIGMLVDLSHVSEKCMLDALEITKAPVIFSHSSAKAICAHPRNVPDNVLRATAENGGVVMVNFYSGYIVPLDQLEKDKNLRGDVGLVCDHIEHIIKVAGIDHVGIGSDYDGVGRLPVGLDDVSYYPNITQELMERGYDEKAIHKILGGNVLRALEQAEDVAAKLKSGAMSFDPPVDRNEKPLFAMTVSSNQVERKDDLVQAEISLPGAVRLPSVVSLVDKDGNAMLAQVQPIEEGEKDRYRIQFVLPELAADKSLELSAFRNGLNPNRVFQWEQREHSDLLTWGGRPVVEFMREPIDESSEKRRAETYKPFHHVFTPDGSRLLTKGPGGLFPHHRGIYYGFNRIKYGDQKADTWHCRNGAYQSFEKNVALEGGPVSGTHQSLIHWRGEDGKAFASELRSLTVCRRGDATQIDFESTLTNVTDKKIEFRGDPQHAGVQLRPSQDVPDLTKHLTYYVRPDGVGKPGKFRNWSNKAKESSVNQNHINLDWLALCIGLPKSKDDGQQEKNSKLDESNVNRLTVGYFPGNGNPQPERFSERDYGRFGCYFEQDLEPGKSFTVRYRYVIKNGEMTVEQLRALQQQQDRPVVVKPGG